jgi:AICAR transformylase/IMP cyclohydrolase PurH
MSFNKLRRRRRGARSRARAARVPRRGHHQAHQSCGAATGATLADALAAAWEGDVVSSFGSVIAVTRPVDLATAQVLKGRFVEALIAPAFEPDALEFLKAKSKDIRLISLDRPLAAPVPRKLTRRINAAR